MSIHPALIAPFMARAPRDFDLDFRNGIYRRNGLIIPSLTGVAGISHTQSGSCWEVAPDGSLVAFSANEPRVVPGLGLWARGSFTNVLARSAEFNDSYWAKPASTITANSVTAPDGTVSADKLVETATTAQHGIRRTAIPATALAPFNFSIFVKPAERSKVQLQYFDGVINRYPVFDLVAGTKTFDGGIGSNWKITQLPGGWFRVEIFGVSGSGATAAQVNVYTNVNGINDTTAGDGVSGFHMWGAQLTSAAQAGPIIVTDAASASNGASVTTIPFVQKDEDFVMLVGFNLADGSTGAIRYLMALTGATTADRFSLFLSAGNNVTRNVQSAGVAQSDGGFTSGGLTNGRGVAALRYRAGKLTIGEKLGVNTVNIGTEGAAITFPVGLANLSIGNLAGSNQSNGVVERTRLLQGTFDNTALANLITEMAA